MSEFLASPVAAVVLLVALTGVLAAVGVYVIGKVRADVKAPEASASQLLTNFQELHERGELSDEEFRTIKAMLAERLQHELSDTDGRG
jgi:hypothetical protein